MSNNRLALFSLFLAMLLASLGTSIANVALPTLAQSFNASFGAVQWVVLAYLVANTVLVIAIGRLGDVFGRRRLLLAGITLFTTASLAAAFAPSLATLIAARAVQGTGAAAMLAFTLAIIGDTVPTAATGRVIGMLGTMSAIGTMLGPSLGGVLIHAFGWRAIFLVKVPLGVVALVAAARSLPVDRIRATSPASRRAGLFTILAAQPALAAGLTMTTIVSIVMMATLVVGPFYLTQELGLGVSVVGMIVAVGPLVAAVTAMPAGGSVDRYGARRITSIGLAGIGMGCVLLASLPATAGVAGYVASIALCTAGYALFQTSNNTTVMSSSPADHRGVVSGALNVSRNVGLIAGASVMGALYAYAGLRLTFAAGAALVGCAALALLPRRAGMLQRHVPIALPTSRADLR